MHVFLTDISAIDEKELKRLAATLPPFRKKSLKRCNEANYPQHVVGFCLVRHAIRSIAPNADTAQWSIGSHGKPGLADGVPFFNLAHTANAIAVAVSATHEVGIDIEVIRPHAEGFAARYFSEEEQAAIAAATDPTSELIRIWTAKEAEGKRLGIGLAAGVKELDICNTCSEAVTVSGVAHWLSVSPAKKPTVTWITTDQL